MTVFGKELFEHTNKNLGYKFKKINFLCLALTHSSVNGFKNNQRLEFLGDAILNFVMAEYLYKYNHDLPEGELTRIRSYLVKEATLYTIAKKLEIRNFLNLGQGELKSGGCNKSSILADTLEAIIAAIYLDSNLNTVRDIIIAWYAQLNYFKADHTVNFSNKNLVAGQKDSKTMLQEFLHAKGLSLPVYEVIKISGEPHKQKFKISCALKDITTLTYGIGTTRKQAEQAAAKKMLELL